MRSMLSTLNSSVEVIEVMASFLPVLGAPFLFISWIMLIKMAYSLFDIKVKSSRTVVQLILFILLISEVWIAYTNLDHGSQLVNENLKYF